MKHNAFSLLSTDTSLFHRSPMPFGGAMASKRVISVIGFEAVESQNLPGIALERMCQRPNFNRAPRGWGSEYCPESNELWKRAEKLKTEALTYAFSALAKVMLLLITSYCNGKKKKTLLWNIYKCGMLLLWGLTTWGNHWMLQSVDYNSRGQNKVDRVISLTFTFFFSSPLFLSLSHTHT